jgi:hypothetical protein
MDAISKLGQARPLFHRLACAPEAERTTRHAFRRCCIELRFPAISPVTQKPELFGVDVMPLLHQSFTSLERLVRSADRSFARWCTSVLVGMLGEEVGHLGFNGLGEQRHHDRHWPSCGAAGKSKHNNYLPASLCLNAWEVSGSAASSSRIWSGLAGRRDTLRRTVTKSGLSVRDTI